MENISADLVMSPLDSNEGQNRGHRELYGDFDTKEAVEHKRLAGGMHEKYRSM